MCRVDLSDLKRSTQKLETRKTADERRVRHCEDLQSRQRRRFDHLATRLEERIDSLDATMKKTLEQQHRGLETAFDRIENLERRLVNSVPPPAYLAKPDSLAPPSVQPGPSPDDLRQLMDQMLRLYQEGPTGPRRP